MKRKIYKLSSCAKQGLSAFVLTMFSVTAFSQSTYTFNYTGSQQTLNLQAGTYSIQAWGGDGYTQTTGYNGKGGYSSGILTLASTQTVYIYVGGLGSYPSTGVTANAWTFNGGGIGYPSANALYGNGGGASDVRTVGGLWDNSASLASRVIVAGGGGAGRNSSYIGGNGGGLTGGTGTYFSPDQPGGPTGGSQTAGGANTGYTSGLTLATLGKAMTWDGSTLTANFLAGGGGGYYGGGSGRVAGGGGSGYIGGVTSGTTIMIGQTGFVANPVTTGDGYVLITELCNITLVSNATNSLNPSICSGQSLTLTTNAISNYSWSTGATTSSLVVSPATSTVYALTAMSPSNCTTSRSISITVSSGLPVLSISNPSNNICQGRTVSLTATGAVTYTWVNAGVVNGQTFTPLSTAVYTVNGQNGCGVTSATTSIVVAPLAVTASASSTLVCEGYPTTLTAVSAVSNYTWQPQALTGSIIVASPLSPVVCTVTASDGTCSGTATVFIQTKVTPTITASASNPQICQGDATTLNASGAGATGTYSWSPGGPGSQISVAPPTTTLYTVMGTNSLNCTGQAQQLVIVNPSPTINITATKTLVCSGQTVSLIATGGNSYVWTGGPPTAAYAPTVNATTVYTVTGGHSTNTCTAVKMVTVTAIIPNLTLPSNTNVCTGSSATIVAGGANTYTFNGVPNGASGVFVLQPQATSTVVIIANTQSLTQNCPVTHTLVLTVNPLPTLNVVPTRSAICKFETNTLTVNGAQSYMWNGTTSGNSFVITPGASLVYTVTGTDANGCESTTFYQAKVNACTGIGESQLNETGLAVYPNPNNGTFVLRSQVATDLVLVNELGQQLKSISLNDSNGLTSEVKDLKPGIYFILDKKGQGTSVQKIVVN